MKKHLMLSLTYLLCALTLMAQQKTTANKPAAKPATAQKPTAAQKANPEKLDKIEVVCKDVTFKHEGKMSADEGDRKYYYRIANDSITSIEYWKNSAGEEIKVKKAALKDLNGGDHQVLYGKVLFMKQVIDIANVRNHKDGIEQMEQKCNRLSGVNLPSEEKLKNSSTISFKFSNEEEAKKFLEKLKPMMEEASKKVPVKK